MRSEEDSNQQLALEGVTPATLRVAVVFMLAVWYFILENYFTAAEYYAETPPFSAIVLIGVLGAGLVYVWLRGREPEGTNHAAFALLSALGFGMAVYSLIPRLNILTDQNGLNEYVYTLDSNFHWQPQDTSLPVLSIYLKSSNWWQQYQPGDTYTFVLRKGGLGIWLVNMSNIYDDQKRFYDCNGVITCMTK